MSDGSKLVEATFTLQAAGRHRPRNQNIVFWWAGSWPLSRSTQEVAERIARGKLNDKLADRGLYADRLITIHKIW